MVAPCISMRAPRPGSPAYVARPIHSNTAQSSPPRMLVISWVQSGKMARVSREIWRMSSVDGVLGSLKVAPGANRPFQSPPAATSMAASAFLDLDAVDVVAAPQDHVLLAVDDIEIALVVQAPQVAGADPAVLPCPGRRFLVAPVAALAGRHLQHDLADLTRRARQAGVVDH